MKLVRKVFSDNREKLKGAGSIVAGTAGIIGSSGLAVKVGGNLYDKILDNQGKISKEEAERLNKELIKEAKRQGTRVIRDEAANNSMYMGSGGGKMVRDNVARLKRKYRRKGQFDKIKDLDRGIESSGLSKEMWKNAGKDTIVLGSGLDDPDILSHELGHSKYMKSGRSKNIIAKAAHKLYAPSKILTASPISGGLSLAHGIHNGLKSEKMRQQGKKESTWHKMSSVALPAIAATPMLVAEAAASKKGLSLLKKSGASKEVLNNARKQLSRAWGTYAAASMPTIAAGEGGRLIGKGIGKLKSKKDNKKEK